ncbi:MAG: aromatic-amino-acid transaminase [Celeribacter sp.]
MESDVFQELQNPLPDVIMQVTENFRADPRANKIDLSVGVYKDAENLSPIMEAVTSAEAWLLENQTSKSYVGTRGNLTFNDLFAQMVLGEGFSKNRTHTLQTPGGVSALRLLLELAADANPKAKVWVSDPTWGNHIPIVKRVGLPCKTYPYYDATSGTVNFAAMCDGLRQIPKGDVILLQACCHNPTGADLSLAQWGVVAEILSETGAVPLVDIAYQGLGNGIEEDAAGLRLLIHKLPEVMIASTCSKSFALYRERTGIALVHSTDPQNMARIAGNMAQLAQANYGMPPDHGAAVVQQVLTDPDLRQSWQTELMKMQTRIHETRHLLAQALRAETNSARFDFLADQQGLFSLLDVTPAQVDRLRSDHAIYIMGNGRCNIAGLMSQDVTRFARAVASVLRFPDAL